MKDTDKSVHLFSVISTKTAESTKQNVLFLKLLFLFFQKQTIVGILTFMKMINFMLIRVKHEKLFHIDAWPLHVHNKDRSHREDA